MALPDRMAAVLAATTPSYDARAAFDAFAADGHADLIPQLQKHLSTRQTVAQIAWLVTGIVLVTVMSSLGEHAH